MSEYIKLILKLAGHVASIVDKENSEQYQEKLYELEKKYDEENDKERTDHNVLDGIERDIMRISGLVNNEASRQKALPMQK